MSDPRYDGSLDAPPLPASLLCVDNFCGEIESHPIHDTNDGDHVFCSKQPRGKAPAAERDAKSARPAGDIVGMSERATAPENASRESKTKARTADPRPCIKCEKPRRNHRGPMDHKFEAAGDPVTEPVRNPTGKAVEPSDSRPEPDASIITPTSSQIADAVERALRGMVIAPRIRIKAINLVPTFAADSDDELLAANVSVSLALIFPRERTA